MTGTKDLLINELKLRIKLLEAQEKLSAKGMEDKLLFWLVSETINHANDVNDLLNGLLERISQIKNISVCSCCQVKNNKLIHLSSFSPQYSKQPQDCLFEIPTNLILDFRKGPKFIKYGTEEFESISFTSELNFEPGIISVFPFQSLYIPFGVFVFVEPRGRENNVYSSRLILQQIVNMSIDKLEKFTLIEELKNLNYSFEKKLRERTKELTDSNKKLKEQIKKKAKTVNRPEQKNMPSEKIEPSILSNVSREIRTPLNGILGFSEIIRNDNLVGKEKDKYINIIKTCGKSLLKIVDDMIDLSKIESNQVKLAKDEVLLASFMTELYDFFHNDELYKQRDDVKLRLNININGNTKIRIDKDRLWQVLINLVGNALKYTEKGHIELGCKILKEGLPHASEEDVLFFVKDTGIGISEEMQKSVFNKFFKIEHEISKMFGGTGLGLTISKMLVEQMGGKIWFDSTPNVGSEFYFSLPESLVLVNGIEKPLTSKELKKRYNWDGKVVLIVEDDEMSYLYLKEVLRSTNVRVIHAKDGQEAIDIVAENQKINIILMDLKLPRIDGYEATRQIKSIRSSVPVIAQTAYAMADDQEKSLKVGCDDYITKPINRRRLLDSMSELIK